MTALLVAGCTALGLAVGAGLEVVIDRVPKRLPLDGWSRRDLKAVRASVVAVATAVLFGAFAVRYSDSWTLPAYLVLAAALVALSVIDLEHFLLPNRIVYPLSLVTFGLLTAAALGDGSWRTLGRAVVASVVAVLAMGALHLVSPRSMGFGDVKLAFVLGLALGWQGWSELALGLFLGFLAGSVIGLALILFRRRSRKDHLPFGPFLAFGTLTALLWGDAILRWYRGR